MKCIVVVPTYNECDNIEPLVAQILELGPEFHVTIVDDNSPDGTGEIADRLAQVSSRVQVLHRPEKQGLGAAYVAGFQHALREGADYVYEMDADFSHDPQRLPDFLQLMDTYDVVIGSRYAKGLAVVNWSVKRLVLSLSANFYARSITGLHLSDCTGGFKCFKREVLESIDLSHLYANGYAFQVEMNYRAARMGYRLGEMPIIFFERNAGRSKMSSRIAREAFWHIFKMRLGSIFQPRTFARRPQPALAAAERGVEP